MTMPFKPVLPIMMYLLLALALLGVALKPGYLFLLDMPWGPHMKPEGFGLLTPLSWILYGATLLLPAWVVQKLVLVLCVAGAGLSMHYLQAGVKARPSVRYLAGVIYACNPFVFERLIAGQYVVLGGYALFPWFITVFRRFGAKPTLKNGCCLALFWGAYPLVSSHWWYMATLVTLPVGLWWLHVNLGSKLNKSRRTALYVAVAASIGLLASAWAMSHSDGYKDLLMNDFTVFATRGGSWVEALIKLVNLYGFWNRSILLPDDVIPAGQGLGPLLLALTILGGWRARRTHGKAVWYLLLLLPLIGLLALGYSTTLTEQLTNAVIRFVPGYLALRDTAKLIGLIAFIYALLAPYGLVAVGTALYKLTSLRPRVVYTAFLALMMAAWYPALNGFQGQLKAEQFPSSWQQVDQAMRARNAKKTLVLPWVAYGLIELDGNAHFMATPARYYFSRPLYTSPAKGSLLLDAGLPDTPTATAIALLYHGGDANTQKALKQLQAQGISHIMVTTNLDDPLIYDLQHFTQQLVHEGRVWYFELLPER